MSKDEKDDVDVYNEKYGRDTGEEELEDILGEVNSKLEESDRTVKLVNYFTESVQAIQRLDYLDTPVAVGMLNQKIADVRHETGLPIPDLYVDDDGVVSTEGVMDVIADITVILFRLSLVAFQRTALFISRLSKSVDGLESRLDRLDPIMKRRKTENLRILLSNKHMTNLVLNNSINTSPVSSASSVVSSVSKVISVLNAYVKKILVEADKVYSAPKDNKYDAETMAEIESEFKDRLKDAIDPKDILLGNRYLEYSENSLLGKSVLVKVLQRPSPKKVLSGQYFIKSLSNDTIESYRESLIDGPLDRLHHLLADTEELYKDLSASKAKGKQNNEGMSESDVKALAGYVNKNVSAVMTTVMDLSKLCYEVVETVVVYMEESAQQEGQDPLESRDRSARPHDE